MQQLLSKFLDRGIATKILSVVGVVAVALVVVGVSGLRGQSAIEQDVDEVYTSNLIPVSVLDDSLTAFGQVRVGLFRHILAAPAKKAQQEERIKQADAKVDRLLSQYEPMAAAPARADLAEARDLLGTYRPLRDQLLGISRSGRTAEAAAFLGARTAPLAERIEQALGAARQAQMDAAGRAAKSAHDTGRSQRRATVVLIILALAISVGAALLVARAIAIPLGRAAEALRRVAEGDLNQRIEVKSGDEVGQMARALDQALDKFRTAMSMIGRNSELLSSSGEELTTVSRQMAGNASEASAQASVVSAAAEQVSRNVETVATGTEEMSASIKEIAKSAADAATTATSALQMAQNSSVTVAKLGESSSEIAGVIKVITSIAEQTNLLALNATIEAARAGEAGKGFAVVAGEVKELAQETAKATDDIAKRIAAIQTDTAAAIAAIDEISGVVAQISDSQTTIAGAVEQQSATTNEITRNVAEAAGGSSEIARNITGVAGAAESATEGAGATQTAADELARMAVELRELVGQFAY